MFCLQCCTLGEKVKERNFLCSVYSVVLLETGWRSNFSCSVNSFVLIERVDKVKK